MSKKEQQDENKERDELLETLQRVQAEFENYKKRVEREQEIYRKHANEGLIKELLPIIDNFSIALENHKGDDEFKKSIELTYAQLIELLEGQGVKRMRSQGERFDPKRHEALMTKESKEAPNTILEVMQEGYTMNDKVLRTARVIVSKKEE